MWFGKVAIFLRIFDLHGREYEELILPEGWIGLSQGWKDEKFSLFPSFGIFNFLSWLGPHEQIRPNRVLNT
jgi:hypothetical protein